MTSLPKEMEKDRSFTCFDLMLPSRSSSVSLLSASSLSNMDDSSISCVDCRRRPRRSSCIGGGGHYDHHRPRQNQYHNHHQRNRWQGCGDHASQQGLRNSGTSTATTGSTDATGSVLLRAPRRKPSNPFLSSSLPTGGVAAQKHQRNRNYQGLVLPTRKQSIPELNLWMTGQQDEASANLRQNVVFPRRKKSVTNLVVTNETNSSPLSSSAGPTRRSSGGSPTTPTRTTSLLARQLLSCPFPIPPTIRKTQQQHQQQKLMGGCGTTSSGTHGSPTYPLRKESHMELYHPASPPTATAMRF